MSCYWRCFTCTWIVKHFFFFSRRSSGSVRWPHERCLSSAVPSPTNVLPTRLARAWRHSAGGHVPAAGCSGVHDVTATALLPSWLPALRTDCSLLTESARREFSGRWKVLRETEPSLEQRQRVATSDPHAGRARLGLDCTKYTHNANHITESIFCIESIYWRSFKSEAIVSNFWMYSHGFVSVCFCDDEVCAFHFLASYCISPVLHVFCF